MGTPFSGRKALAIALLLITATASAESWELQPAAGNVPGSTEIKAGQFEDAIRILMLEVDSGASDTYLGVLENLCVAYAAQLEYDIAMRYCDQAAGHSSASACMVNNRGALRAIIKGHRGALQEFQRASCMRSCSLGSACKTDSVKASIRRNLARVKQRESSSRHQAILFQPRA